jgi:hypothetical protein
MAAMFSGALSLRMREASSLKVISSRQCKEFSILQCVRTAFAASLALQGRLEIKCSSSNLI